MGRRLVAWLSAAACLAGTGVGAQAGQDDGPGGADAAPAWHGPALQRSRAGFERSLEDEPSPLKRLARGTLWRAQLDEDTSLSLRLRGGKLGLVLAVRFNSGGG